MPRRSGEREAGWQLPPSLDDLLPTDHAVRFVAAYLDSFDPDDWARLGIRLEGARRGAASYHPLILLSTWVWGFMTGIRSSRKLEAACREMLSFRWLTGQQTPDHNTLWRFYQAHRVGMRSLLTHSVHTALRAGLVDLALQAVDGTKIAGNAARDRTFDQKGLVRLETRLDAAIADLEAQNATGGDDTPPDLPDALQSTTALRERVRQAKADLVDGGRINLTDGEARLMKGRGGYLAGYNAQAVVSPLAEEVAGGSGMLITAAEVTTAPDDHDQLVPMMTAAAATTGVQAAVTAADGGYHSAANLVASTGRCVVMPEAQPGTAGPYHQDRFIYDAEADTYTCPEGQVLTLRGVTQVGVRVYRILGGVCRTCPAFGVCTRNWRQGRMVEINPQRAILHTHRTWMATDEAKALYARRKTLIEPVFGILKEQQGVRRFLLRGKAAVGAEWSLVAAAFNLRTLARLWRHGVLLVGLRPALP